MSGERSRFTLEIDADTAKARAAIKSLGGEIDGVKFKFRSLAEETGVQSKGLSAALLGVDKDSQVTSRLSAIGAMTYRLGGEFRHLGAAAIDAGVGIVKGIAGAFLDISKEASTFQDLESRFNFLSGGEAAGSAMFEQTKKAALDLNFSLEETSNLVLALQQQHIDPFKDKSMNKAGQMQTALMTMQDIAVATGMKTEDTIRSIGKLMGGLPREFLNKTRGNGTDWGKDIKKLSMDGNMDKQEKFQKIVDIMTKEMGGATASKKTNLSFLVAQLPDFLQQFKAAIGKEANKIISDAVGGSDGEGGLRGALTKLFDTKTANFSAFGEAFNVIARVLRSVIIAFTQLVVWVDKFTKEHKGVVTFAMVLTLAAAAGLILVGVVMSIIGSIFLLAGAVAAMVAIGWEPFVAALVIGLPLLAVLGLLLLAASVGYRVLQEAFSSNMGGIRTLIDNFHVLVTAVIEFLDTYDKFSRTGQISEDTAAKLESSGLLKYFLIFANVVAFVQDMIDAFSATITSNMGSITPKVDRLLAVISELINTVAKDFDTFGRATNGSASGMGGWVTVGVFMASVAIDLFKALVEVTIIIIRLISLIYAFVSTTVAIIDAVMGAGAALAIFKMGLWFMVGLFALLAIAATVAFVVMAACILIILSPLLAVLAVIMLIIRAVNALAGTNAIKLKVDADIPTAMRTGAKMVAGAAGDPSVVGNPTAAGAADPTPQQKLVGNPNAANPADVMAAYNMTAKGGPGAAQEPLLPVLQEISSKTATPERQASATADAVRSALAGLEFTVNPAEMAKAIKPHLRA